MWRESIKFLQLNILERRELGFFVPIAHFEV